MRECGVGGGGGVAARGGMKARRRDDILTPKLLLFDIRVAVVLSLGRCCYELNKEKGEQQKDSLCCGHYVTNKDGVPGSILLA